MKIKIIENFSLKELNTFGLKVRCRYFVQPTSLSESLDLVHQAFFKTFPSMIIGDGSNILFAADFDGLVIRPGIVGWEVVEENPEDVMVKAGAGTNWADSFVPDMIRAGYWGVENLSLIPGTVGAAPFQNIGAYGVEAKDVVAGVEGLDLVTGTVKNIPASECAFTYRSSRFKNEMQDSFLITSVFFKLSKKPVPVFTYGRLKESFASTQTDLKKIAAFIIKERKKKLPDPIILGNAGSFFKNPLVNEILAMDIRKEYPDVPFFPAGQGQAKIPAGWLIEKCGWKGKREGAVGVFPRHALVIVNYGGATGEEIFDFSEKIRHSVLDRFDIDLEREVRVVLS